MSRSDRFSRALTAFVAALMTAQLVACTSVVYEPFGEPSEPLVTVLARVREEVSRREQYALQGAGKAMHTAAFDILLMAKCATGELNANEDWVAYRNRHTLEIVYRNQDRGYVQYRPPCVRFLTHVHELKQRDPPPPLPPREVFDPVKHRYIPMDEDYPVREHRRSHQKTPKPGDKETPARSLSIEDSYDRHEFLAENPFAFVLPLDFLDAIVQQKVLVAPSEDYLESIDLRKHKDVSPGDHTHSGIYDLLLFIMAEERALHTQDPRKKPFDTTWTDMYTLEDWGQLRERTSSVQRTELAGQWTRMAKVVLVTGKNATVSINCLRRALCWNPGYVPAYRVLSSILKHYGMNETRCQLSEKMLELVNTSEYGADEVQQTLARVFPSCGVLARVATVWESTQLMWYVAATCISIATAHVLFRFGRMRTKDS